MDTRSRSWPIPAAIAAATTLAHLLTAADTYGIFRDELYYVACSEHLAFGYVDHPPLVALLTRIMRSLLGDSLTALRFLPAVAAGVTVLLISRIAREMNGSRFAQSLAATMAALAPSYVASFGFLSMNAYDLALWAGAVAILARTLRTGKTAGWIPFGFVAGIGLQNKISLLFLGFGVAVGLVLSREWRQLRSARLWLGGAIAGALFLPHLVWQAVNDWPTLEFMENATQNKNLPIAPVEFLRAQALEMGPAAAAVAILGLAWLITARAGKPWRTLGWAVLAVLLLLISQRSKPYYFAPAFTILFASGGVALARLTSDRLRWLRPVVLAAVVLLGLAVAPLAKPLLPVERHIAYARALGQAPSTSERKEVGRLSQFFADRLGWRELAETVGRVAHALPPDERAKACVFSDNYGQAGAIDFWSEELDLPPSIAGHNSYFLWGPGECTGDVLIVIGANRARLEELFENVELRTTYTCRDCMPYENNKPIWVCRNLKPEFDRLWPDIGHYD